MRYSPDVAFTASLGAPVFALTGSAQAIAVALPTLGAADLGNVLAFTFASAPASAFAVVLSVPANPVAYASSLFFLDPAVWLTIGSGSQGPTGADALRGAAAPEPALRRRRLCPARCSVARSWGSGAEQRGFLVLQ